MTVIALKYAAIGKSVYKYWCWSSHCMSVAVCWSDLTFPGGGVVAKSGSIACFVVN